MDEDMDHAGGMGDDGELEEAMGQFDAALEQNPNNIEVHSSLKCACSRECQDLWRCLFGVHKPMKPLFALPCPLPLTQPLPPSRCLPPFPLSPAASPLSRYLPPIPPLSLFPTAFLTPTGTDGEGQGT